MCFVKYSISNLTNSLIVKCLVFLNLLFPLSTFRFSNERRLKVKRGKGLFQTVTYQNCFVTSCLLLIPQTMPFCSAWKTSRYYNICLQYFQWLLCSIFTVKCVHKPPWVSLKRPPPFSLFGIYLTCSLSDLNFIVVLQILQRHWHISSILSVNTCRRKNKLENQIEGWDKCLLLLCYAVTCRQLPRVFNVDSKLSPLITFSWSGTSSISKIASSSRENSSSASTKTYWWPRVVQVHS